MDEFLKISLFYAALPQKKIGKNILYQELSDADEFSDYMFVGPHQASFLMTCFLDHQINASSI